MSEIYFDPGLYPEEAAALAALQPRPRTRIFGIDISAPAEGVAALIAARRAGFTCAVFPIFADPYEGALATILGSIEGNRNIELRSQQLDALSCGGLLVNEKKPIDFASIPEAQVFAGSLALRLADLVLLGAPGERDRWDEHYKRVFRRFEILPVVPVSMAQNVDEQAVTIYAPSLPRERLGIYVSLLRSRRIEPRVICAENAREPIASRVVVTPEWRPIRSRALAAGGYHVVAPNTTGVDECDSRIFGYDPIDHRIFLGAVDAAFGITAGADRIHATPEDTARAIEREAATSLDGPRASIIVRTFDRPALLARAVASIAAQTHRDVEIVVVNNGGNDVRDVIESAAAGRLVRYEQMSERKHISAASNVGARAATGKYIGYLDDDDLLYADHCARTVEALERTGADLAFTMCLGEYAQMNGDEKRVLGYQVYLDRMFYTEDVYITNITPIHSVVHPRALFDRFGYFDESLPVTDDWELWLRVASGGGRFLRIDRVTCEYSWRYDPQRGNMTVEHQWDFVNAYAAITQRYGPDVAGRTQILAQQRSMLASQTQRAKETADPSKRAAIVISSMSATMVPVAVVPESPREH